MTLPPGFYTAAEVPKSLYLSDPCERPSLSASIAKLIVAPGCPKKAWQAHPRLGGGSEPSDRKCLVNGTCIDSLLMGGDGEIVFLPGEMPDAKGKMQPTRGEFRMESAKEWRDEQRAAGKTVLGSRAELVELYEAAAGIRASFADQDIYLTGSHQMTCVWYSPDGVLCRARLDQFIEPKDGEDAVIGDLKSTWSAHPDACGAAIVKYGYDIQAAAYVEAIETLMPDLAGRVQMRFLFAECKPPYLTLPVPFEGSIAQLGQSRWKEAKAKWAISLASGKWPGYATGLTRVAMSPWQVQNAIAVGYEVEVEA